MIDRDPNIETVVGELSLWCLAKMDLLFVNTAVSLLGAVVMMATIIYTITYILGSFSSKSGAMSPKFALCSFFYFFGSTVFLFMGVEWLTDVARVVRAPVSQPYFLSVGAIALGFTALLNLFCGFLTAFLYLREQVSKGLTLQRVLNSIRARLKSKQRTQLRRPKQMTDKKQGRQGRP